jgi:hypothetical protein
MNAIARKNYQSLIIILLALFNVAIRLLVIGNLGYHRDELLYFSLGQHPDAREYGIAVYLCEDPKTNFNEFWANQLKDLRDN